jgi:hypothetical protein
MATCVWPKRAWLSPVKRRGVVAGWVATSLGETRPAAAGEGHGVETAASWGKKVILWRYNGNIMAI